LYKSIKRKKAFLEVLLETQKEIKDLK